MNKHVETLTPSMGWNTITHNFDTIGVVVAVYRKDNRMLVSPNSYHLELTDSNSVQIIFGSPIDGDTFWAVVIG